MPKKLRVLLVTSWDTPCGIAEHSRLLKEHVEAADRDTEIAPSAEDLDPTVTFMWFDWSGPSAFDLVHLNHHDALHSRWTADHVLELRKRGVEVLVTYHDTYAQMPEGSKIRQLQAVASSLIVHEPVEDLPAIYWRQGVPQRNGELQFDRSESPRPPTDEEAVIDATPYYHIYIRTGYRPVVGTVGFPFPWKNYDLLCEAAALAGWTVVLIAPSATDDQITRWRTLNPWTHVIRGFLPGSLVVSTLAGCDATAFLYSCANSGTSGAIRQGIAARKPVLASHPSVCRQFRDLMVEDGPRHGFVDPAIHWITALTPEGVAGALVGLPICVRAYPPVHVLAERDSWAKLGANYAQLYRTLTGGTP